MTAKRMTAGMTARTSENEKDCRNRNSIAAFFIGRQIEKPHGSVEPWDVFQSEIHFVTTVFSYVFPSIVTDTF